MDLGINHLIQPYGAVASLLFIFFALSETQSREKEKQGKTWRKEKKTTKTVSCLESRETK